MTTERDFDGLARAWLELGPDEAPERSIAAILQATDTMPQARRRFRWPAWRELRMSRSPLLIGVWATVLIAVAGIALLNRPDRNNNAGTPTSPPSSIASRLPATPAPAPAELDPRLVGQWMGDRRPIVEIPMGDGTRLVFTDFGASYLTPATGPMDNYVTSAASMVGGTLRLVTGTNLNSDCTKGDVGTYTWSMSASGRVLRIDASLDDCIPRIAAIVGSWWRIGCHDVGDGCLGALDAATYQSAFVGFHDALPGEFPVAYGNLTYTVPDGWANSADFGSLFALEPADEYRDAVAGDNPYQHVQVMSRPTVAAQDAACSATNEPGIDNTVAGVMHAITRLPSVSASTPTPLTINGLTGQMVDLSLSPSWRGICPDMDGVRSAAVLREAGSGDEGWRSRLGPSDRARLIVLELGGGNLVAIAIVDTRSQDSFDAFVTDAMPVVQSMHFR